jgi:hypothetical protein
MDSEYRPHFTSYTQFDQPTQELLKLISRKFDLPRPIDIQMFKINTHRVRRILIDIGSSIDVMYFDSFIKMGYNPLHLVKVNTPLVGFTGVAMVPEGLIRMRVEFSTLPRTISLMINFLVVKASLTYNIILGRKILYELRATISMSCLKMKF